MEKEVNFQKALSYAVFLLNGKMYSVAELAKKLHPRFPAVAEAVLAELLRTGLLDDARYARVYAEYRLKTAPRGKMLLTQELKQKGVAPETIAETLADFCEEELIDEVARRKAASLPPALSPEKRREKLFRFLASRGFAVGTIMACLKRVE